MIRLAVSLLSSSSPERDLSQASYVSLATVLVAAHDDKMNTTTINTTGYRYRRRAAQLLVCCFCFMLCSHSSAERPPIRELTLAYAPILSRQLVESRSKPLVNYFKKQHQIDIHLIHSANFDDYLNKALNKQFDLTISQINYAEAFYNRLQFQPLVKSKRQFHLLILKRKEDDSLHSLEQLTNKTIGVPAGPSFISALFSNTLNKHGIDASQQMKLVYFNRHDVLLLSLLRADIDAAITVEILLEMASHSKDKLIIVDKIPAGPAVISASPKLNKFQQQWLTQALLEFAQSAPGKRYASSLALDQLEPISIEEFDQFHRYATPLHNKLKKNSSL